MLCNAGCKDYIIIWSNNRHETCYSRTESCLQNRLKGRGLTSRAKIERIVRISHFYGVVLFKKLFSSFLSSRMRV